MAVQSQRMTVEEFDQFVAQQVRKAGLDGVLDGGDVLPGFSVAVREIFQA